MTTKWTADDVARFEQRRARAKEPTTPAPKAKPGRKAKCRDSQTLWIAGLLPSYNDILAAAKRQRGKYSPYNDLKKQWAKNIGIEIERCGIKPMSAVRLVFTFVEQNDRRDVDGVYGSSKYIIDALKTHGVIVDDSQKYVKSIEYRDLEFDQSNPGVRVELRPYNPR